MASILLVDDDEATRRLVNLILLEAGDYEVRQAGVARDALAELHAHMPDLLILDVRLPDMEGAELLEHVRRAGYEGPVLALTASSAHDPLLESLRSEGDSPSIMLKPFDVDELVERVAMLLASPSNGTSAAEPE